MAVRVLDDALCNLNVLTRRSQDRCLLQSPCQKFMTMDFGRKWKVSDGERHVETDTVEPRPLRNVVVVVDGDPLAPVRHPQTGTQCR